MTKRILAILLIILVYQVITSFGVVSYRVNTGSMAPTLKASDLVLATPMAHGAHTLFGKLPGIQTPMRGDIVIAYPPYSKRGGFLIALADSLLRFFTFQQLSFFSSSSLSPYSAPIVARIIALPGDSVMMEESIFKVKEAGSVQYLTEFELTHAQYDIEQKPRNVTWKKEFPASGYMEPKKLAQDEYFIASDSRMGAQSSQLWGPISADQLQAKVLLRYWPFKSFGLP